MYVHILHNTTLTADWWDVARVTIDLLPDVALLEIFDFFLGDGRNEEYDKIRAWYTLVHVCQKWRDVVFGSPHRLKLQLYCTASSPVRDMLGVWPPLPIIIGAKDYTTWGVDNIIAALEHTDRITQLRLLDISSPLLDKVFLAMQAPFPALTHVVLKSREGEAPIVPTSFLGGSAPGLQSLILDRIPFPQLPELLLSATHLVRLHLQRIPHSGYISPEALATCLSVLTRLESLKIAFESPQSRPERNSRQPPPRTRITLPVLVDLRFQGVCEYLEDLLAGIDTPLLNKLLIRFFHQLIFDTPQLNQFISRTPKLKVYNKAAIYFSSLDTLFVVAGFGGWLQLGIICSQSDWQLSSVVQFFSSSFLPALDQALEELHIYEDRSYRPRWQDDIGSSQWLELFQPFTAVTTLYITREFVPRIALTLQELVGGRMREVLPALQYLLLEEPLPPGPVEKAIVRFVAARGHPVSVSLWEAVKQ